MKRHAWIAIAVGFAACGKGGGTGDRPKLAQMPPGAEGLVIGASTEAQVTAKLPGAEISKDRSLGGSMVVEFNDHKAENQRTDATTATLWKDAGGTLRLMAWQSAGAGLCDWAAKTTATMSGSMECGGNRKMDPGERQWCVASSDGALRVVIDCHADDHHAGGKGDQLEIRVLD